MAKKILVPVELLNHTARLCNLVEDSDDPRVRVLVEDIVRIMAEKLEAIEKRQAFQRANRAQFTE